MRRALALVLLAGPACAADYPEALYRPGLPSPAPGPVPGPSMPRYFPRSDGTDSFPPSAVGRPVRATCQTRQVPVPTNAPDDPSYVGSPYGLGKPSYYGFTPPRGVDDPYGRSLLRYCP